MSLLVHPENQQLIWNIISSNPFASQFFQVNTHINKEQWFKTMIEHFYNMYKGQNIDKNDLNHLNKEILTYMIQNLHNMSSQNKPPARQPEVFNTPSTIPTPPIPENNREELYKQQFLQKQQEYQSLLERKIPANVDFREKDKDTAISNMDELIKQQINERNAYLNLHPAPSQNVLPAAATTIPQNNIQLVPETTDMKKNVKIKVDANTDNAQILKLLDEQKSELSSLRSLMIELSKQVGITNDRFNAFVTQSQTSSKINTTQLAQPKNNDVLVETVENDNE
jgi:hypothetical protein